MPNESPISASRFSISVDGVQIGQFSELMGISTEIKPVSFGEGGLDALLLNALTANRTPPVITLRRPRSNDMRLQSWFRSRIKKNCTLTIHNRAGSPVHTYNLTLCWPKTLEVGGFKAGGSTQMETVSLVADRIQRVS